MRHLRSICAATASLLAVLVCLVLPANATEDKSMQITVSANGVSIAYQLNDSTASKELYAQLPMTIEVEDYGGLEKIFYPPNKLATSDTPLVKKANVGTLAYYAPWGDVVMFYKGFGSASGLYELGHAISGADQITSLSGTIQIEKSGD
jgi:hypothetical protein